MTVITRYVAQGTLRFTGPAELLERPTPEEICAAFDAREWRSGFERQHAEGQAKLGHIETRFQLNYFCSEPGVSTDIGSYGFKYGVRVQSHPKPRGKVLR